jgi:uncharacterized protein YbaR (Trm112 family)
MPEGIVKLGEETCITAPPIIHSSPFFLDLKESLMQIIAQCPTCKNNYLLDAAAADRRIRCPECLRLYKVPRIDEMPKAEKILKQAKGTIYVDSKGKTYG